MFCDNNMPVVCDILHCLFVNEFPLFGLPEHNTYNAVETPGCELQVNIVSIIVV